MGSNGRPEEALEACCSGPCRGWVALEVGFRGGLGKPCSSVLGVEGKEQDWSKLMPRPLAQATERARSQEEEERVCTVVHGFRSRHHEF